MSIFTNVQSRKPKTNTFDLSHDRKFSLSMGNLVPILCMDVIPGDSIRMSTSQMLRFAPLIAPIMHKVNVYTHFFFVPNRLLWDNWETFITGGEDGMDNSVFPTTYFQGNANNSSLTDYLGLPTGSQTDNLPISALPFAAYNFIWNEYYRDQNLQEKLEYKLTDGDQDWLIPPDLQKRAWHHDYFTSALPWTQKGPEATIPLGGLAPIQGSAANTLEFNAAAGPSAVTRPDLGTITGNDMGYGGGTAIKQFVRGDGSQDFSIDITPHTAVGVGPDWAADLSVATAASINDLRRAFKLQEWLEKNARGGSRYFESILVHFGVHSPDARLQRPEFLGGGSSPITISEVLQTSDASAEQTPQGNMAGHGISVGSSNNFSYRAVEHGYIMGIMSVLPMTAYQQGIPKHFRKFDKFDYFWPSFAHLGEQPIYNWEIYVDEDSLSDNVFGYTPRYAEYKYMPSTVHGEFRDTLNFWHMGRIFENRPHLNSQFITSDPTTRIFAVTDAPDQLYCHTFHRIKARRPMPFYGTPTI